MIGDIAKRLVFGDEIQEFFPVVFGNGTFQAADKL
jgi:hypothetical protein